MNKVFSFELHKLFRSKSFYIWTAISIVLSVAFLVASFIVYKKVSAEALMAATQGTDVTASDLTMSPESGIISMVQFFAQSPIAFCIVIFVCNFVCEDFENGILKNVISKGYTRTAVFGAKYITLLIASFIMTALNAIIIFAVSSILYGDVGEGYLALILQMFLLFFGILTFTGLFFMLCTILKKNAPAVTLSILALILMPQTLNLITAGLKLKDFNLGVLWFGSQLDYIAKVNVSTETLLGAALCIAIYFVLTSLVWILSVKKMEV